MPSFHATRFASVRSSIVQHPPYVESALLRLSYICIDRPTTSWPAALRMYAAVEESTPPDIATAIFIVAATLTAGIGCACPKPSGPIRLGRRRRPEHPQDDHRGLAARGI